MAACGALMNLMRRERERERENLLYCVITFCIFKKQNEGHFVSMCAATWQTIGHSYHTPDQDCPRTPIRRASYSGKQTQCSRQRALIVGRESVKCEAVAIPFFWTDSAWAISEYTINMNKESRAAGNVHWSRT